jgi:hypothetical protein
MVAGWQLQTGGSAKQLQGGRHRLAAAAAEQASAELGGAEGEEGVAPEERGGSGGVSAGSVGHLLQQLEAEELGARWVGAAC